ncbi:MAG: S8 family peptidase [Pseudomonadota bacterium]|nr:S8 family peptidase [Pseudomonadota bacterium]
MRYFIFVLAFSLCQESFAKESVVGEYLVKLKEEFMQTRRDKIRKHLGVKKIRDLRGPKNWVLVNTNRSLASLKKNIIVENAEPNFIFRAELQPNDTHYLNQWGLKNTGQADSDGTKGEADIDTNVEKAWDTTTGSPSIVVAVIDTGVEYKYKDLAPNAWINEREYRGEADVDDDRNGFVDDIYGYDFVNEDGEPLDDHGHGSHCAGTIGARGNDGHGMAGINWQVKIMPVKFLSKDGSGTLAGALEAIKYAVDNGAKVLSNSWGGGEKSQALEDVIKYSHEKGVLFVASAGNDGEDSDRYPHYPSGYQVPNVISVAALNNKGQVPEWSNFGKETVHLAAPGENILSIANGGYQSWSGTSMAAPFVSGVAALSLSMNPNMTGMQIKEKILSSVKKIDAIKNKVITGGIVDAFGAL